MVLDARPVPSPMPPSASADLDGGPYAGPVLWLVRHGESTWNALGLAQGQSDQPRLTSRGLRQAHEAAQQLRGAPIGAMYASDLRRAVATAEPVATALGLEFTRDSRLRERHLGVLQGVRSAAVPEALSGVAGTRVIDPDARPPDGESLRDMYWRVAGFADERLTAVRDQLPYPNFPAPGAPLPAPGAGNSQIAVVAHGGTLRVLIAYLRGIPVERMTWGPIVNGCTLRLPPHQPNELSEPRQTACS